jgi:three-Cys-motif partner protein
VSEKQTSVTWPIQPHTEAKHAILAAYLRAWFPILSLGGFDRVIYIDGFAGPGRYAEGQDGSPILALGALAAQTIPLEAQFEFHFVERDEHVAAALAVNLEDLRARGLIPAKADVRLHPGQTFEEAYERAIRPRLSAFPGAPAFALVDPFGWTGIPMQLVAELLQRPSTEILVNFMFEEINRFLAHPDQPQNFDALFGCGEWQKALGLVGADRKRFLHDLYRDQLHSAGRARYVRSFEMRNQRGVVDYFLFFATNSLKGLEKMKEAMWRVDPAGGFTFSDATDTNQAVLFEPKPDRNLLRRFIERRFSGKRARREEVERFVVEHTPFLATHYKRVLRQMEIDGRLSAIDPPKNRRFGTYPSANLVLEFSK